MSTSNFYYGAPHHAAHLNAHQQHNHPGGRPRRAPRSAAAHNHKQFRAVRTPKEVVEAPNVVAFRRDFEAARSFDIEDDEMFCPFHLLTEDDLQSIHSSGSDRSSLSSGSPDSSPLQHQLQPTPSFVLSSATNSYTPTGFNTSQTKLHQPLAQRTRNAIPIVDPSTRSVASPPPSVSPARQMQHQFIPRRW
ncbi:uncharacterized protein K452DRAFT_220766 [Aplosporella prunicola CBS 121167]|uniref:Uncharacterized protein n=1 Tax=Aplosporella prunicola CBS 121167 TaxID=1176127 RepID=A0A6A6BPK4_9PEZI|nr:uncharacterized protein K452DRAFT_220766 [Aplosporella prunicola CBS 121167]KAF2145648.1 hypothetical protein K452DRAFT_220766 [Aplosporella prunicola CBS 121167]